MSLVLYWDLKKTAKILSNIFIFGILTILTQIGGIVYLLSEFFAFKFEMINRLKRVGLFISIYAAFTFLLVPFIAPIFGRVKVNNTETIKPTNYMTIILNRNYVKPELNDLLNNIENKIKESKIKIHYLDANFPFINKFPLLPHLSHNDGKKIDISLIYESQNGQISNKQKSISGYGIFEGPKKGESNQIKNCITHGYFQYDFPKYLTFGEINKDLVFSKTGTKLLINAILLEQALGKLFIEPHLKERLHLNNNKVRYHGCGAVRHDDHIHIQLK